MNCCICGNGDDPQAVNHLTHDTMVDEQLVYLEVTAMPVSDDETKYICDFCTQRAIRMMGKDIETDYTEGEE